MTMTPEETNALLDRVGERVELATMRAFEAHREKEHEPLIERVRKLERSQWYERGAFAGIVGLIEFLRSK